MHLGISRTDRPVTRSKTIIQAPKSGKSQTEHLETLEPSAPRDHGQGHSRHYYITQQDGPISTMNATRRNFLSHNTRNLLTNTEIDFGFLVHQVQTLISYIPPTLARPSIRHKLYATLRKTTTFNNGSSLGKLP